MLDFKEYDGTMLGTPDEKVDWIWDGCLMRGGMTNLASPPKAGKSTLLFDLLAAMRDGRPFLNINTRAGTRILLFTEEPIPLMRQRWERMGDMPNLRIVPLLIGLTWQKIVPYCKIKAQNDDRQLIIIDTLSRFWDVQDENDGRQVDAALTPLLTVCRNTGFALLLIHHTRKSGGAQGSAVRGSSALTGNADIILELSRLHPQDRGPRRRLSGWSRFGGVPDGLVVERGATAYTVVEHEEEGRAGQAILQLIEQEGLVTAERAAETVGQTVRSAQRILSDMVNRGVVVRTGTGNPFSPYQFSLEAGRG